VSTTSELLTTFTVFGHLFKLDQMWRSQSGSQLDKTDLQLFERFTMMLLLKRNTKKRRRKQKRKTKR
jgi:hypothetical protein